MHCQECGTKLIEKELENEGIVPFCPSCGQFRFPLYNVAVSMIVIDESNDKILLIKQYGKPSFILVAGYVNKGEQLEHGTIFVLNFKITDCCFNFSSFDFELFCCCTDCLRSFFHLFHCSEKKFSALILLGNGIMNLTFLLSDLC